MDTTTNADATIAEPPDNSNQPILIACLAGLVVAAAVNVLAPGFMKSVLQVIAAGTPLPR